MKPHFQKYYRSETQNAWMRMLAGGVSALIVGVGYWMYTTDVLAGICFTIIPIGAYQFGRGVKKLWRSSELTERVNRHWSQQKNNLIRQEIDYLNKRIPKYKFHRNMEIIFIFSGITLAAIGTLGGVGRFMLGTGIGLAFQGGVALYLELVAEWYAGFFLTRLERTNQS